MHKYISEFIGTFFLILTIGCSVLLGVTGVIPPLAIGSILMAMIYAGGHVSGAHYNPAVTLAVWLRGRLSMNDFLPYIIAQFVAAIAAAYTVLIIKNTVVISAQRPVTALAIDPLGVGLVEFLYTFALAYVVLNVATTRATAGNSYYGLAIGFTVLAGAFAVGTISGAAFNPAVVIAANIFGLISWNHTLIYFIAELAGAAAAAYAFKFIHSMEKTEQPF